MKISVESIEKIKIRDSQDIYEIIQKVFYERKEEVDLMQEHFWVFSLNKSLKILNIELIGIGSKDRVIADPGDVFRVPLYKSSSYIILVHNHPSGSLKPSNSDIELTNRLMKAGDILDIKVIEHVIVTANSYFSFRSNGLIEKLEMDTTYALSFIYEKKMKRRMEQLKAEVEKERKKGRLAGIKEGKKKGEEIGLRKGKKEGREEGLKEGELKGKREEKIEIAKQMLIDGESMEKITRYTGLTRQWIGRIKNEIEKEKFR